ncbi:Signal transduction histidine kinase [Duganella sp. CF458]|uniref:sensor histidine kinase n=1 Tax=Duganella sp. CF458 TaxID=1884368 RepID=UPI0008DFC853|nr:sensor histidine kinase [Duganella sp. CF458]SFG08230.1 Signal transduction histidine kinase [Duganella sp. CF458]
MTSRRLPDFIRDRIETILQEWEDFARTIEPPALTMGDHELRDHAHQMLMAFADDLETPQTDPERAAKSKGNGVRDEIDAAAETHAEARLLSGYTVIQLVSEYRALRSAVLALWAREAKDFKPSHMAEMTRFNEAVDQALAVSVARYEMLVKRSQNMFLAILGHDLRNPLGSIMAGATFIAQDTEVPSKCAEVAERMLNSSKRMRSLVNDLIDFTRAKLGPGMPLQPTDNDLVQICEQVVDEIRTYHPDRKVRLHAPSTLAAIFDGDRVSQMLSNLVGNAIQHGDAKTPVVVKVTKESDTARISINNKGVPIPVEQIPTVFDPLVRGANSESKPDEHGSLGLGLFVSREIANAHGGDVLVSSDASEGTTFTVVLPLDKS